MTPDGEVPRVSPTAVKWLFVVPGALVMLIGLDWLGYSGFLVTRGLRTDGVVVGGEVESEGALSAPVVSFKTAEGRAVQFTSVEYAESSQYSLGRHVPVVYDPAAPERAEIDSAETLWLGGAACFGVGLACVAAGYGAAWTMRKVRGS